MRGKATGERIEPSKKRKVIEMAIQGHTTNKIANTVKLDWSTAKAIEDFNSKTIQERKIVLADQFARIAHIGAERLLAELSTLPAGSLIPAVGMSCDKVLALTSDPTTISNTLHVHLNKIDVIGEFNQTLAKLGLLKNAQGNGNENDPENASSAHNQKQIKDSPVIDVKAEDSAGKSDVSN